MIMQPFPEQRRNHTRAPALQDKAFSRAQATGILLSLFLFGLIFSPSNVVKAQTSPSEKSFKEWIMRCPDGKESRVNPCILFHRILLDNGYPLVVVQISRSAQQQGDFLAIFDVPLGVYLPTGITVTIDEGETFRLNFERCDQNGCYAGTILSNEIIESLKRGKKALLSFVDAASQKITATVSLSGITAGLDGNVQRSCTNFTQQTLSDYPG